MQELPWAEVVVVAEDLQASHKAEGAMAAMVACAAIHPQYLLEIDPSPMNSLKTSRSTGWPIKGTRQ